MDSYVKYYKFGPIFNYGNDKVALSRKLGSDLNITYVETTFKDVKSVIKDIFPIEDRVHFVRISNQEVLIHELCYAKDYLNILSGKYPYFRVKLLVGEEAKASGVVKVVNKMLSDQIRDLELTIKSTEAGLVAKRNLYENNQTQKDLAFKRAQRIRSYDKMHNDIHKKENC